jgi:hypothetical protein
LWGLHLTVRSTGVAFQGLAIHSLKGTRPLLIFIGLYSRLNWRNLESSRTKNGCQRPIRIWDIFFLIIIRGNATPSNKVSFFPPCLNYIGLKITGNPPIFRARSTKTSFPVLLYEKRWGLVPTPMPGGSDQPPQYSTRSYSLQPKVYSLLLIIPRRPRIVSLDCRSLQPG